MTVAAAVVAALATSHCSALRMEFAAVVAAADVNDGGDVVAGRDEKSCGRKKRKKARKQQQLNFAPHYLSRRPRRPRLLGSSFGKPKLRDVDVDDVAGGDGGRRMRRKRRRM